MFFRVFRAFGEKRAFREKMKSPGILVMFFGALDLLAFYRCFPKLVLFVENYSANVYRVLVLIVIVSLLVSGPLLMIGSRIGYVVYYFQFPIRLTSTPLLTFGFFASLLPLTPGTLYFGMLSATMFALEAIRLMHTIQRHRIMS